MVLHTSNNAIGKCVFKPCLAGRTYSHVPLAQRVAGQILSTVSFSNAFLFPNFPFFRSLDGITVKNLSSPPQLRL